MRNLDNSQRYLEILRAAVDMRERNDCTVRAVAMTAGVDYASAWRALAERGRRRRCAVLFEPIMRGIMREFGCALQSTDYSAKCMKKGGLYTARTIAKAYPRGTYLIHVRGHVYAMIDGQIFDGRPNNRRRIDWIREVIPLAAPAEVSPPRPTLRQWAESRARDYENS